MSVQAPTSEAPVRQTCPAWLRPALNDPRDSVFVFLSLAILLVQVPCAVAFFFLGARDGGFTWWLAPPYWALWGYFFLDRYILMLHCVSHRPLFRPRFRGLNKVIPFVIGPFCGESPETYFVHHMGMHHKEGNLPADLSSTMKYRRDSLVAWLRYFSRFFFLSAAEVPLYMFKRRRHKLAKRFMLGELGFWLGVVALGALLSWQATVVVFVVPVLLVRFLMMAGNWGQHAFVDAERPENSYVNSITCINTRYNRRCFNDGYHIVHHLKPALHYSEMPKEFAANQPAYGAQDAIVFDGLDFFEVWALLMTKRWKKLARHFARLPGAPDRDEAQAIAFLQSRVAAFSPEALAVAATRKPV